MIRLKRGSRGMKLNTPDGLVAAALPPSWTSIGMYGVQGTRGQLYRVQPNIRPVIDFIADAASHVPIKVYSRVPSSKELPTGRLELEDHPMATLLDHPSPKTTRSRFWKELVADYLIYDVAYAQKIRIDGAVKALVRIPPSALYPVREPLASSIPGIFTQQGPILRYRTVLGTTISLDDLIIFQGYDPEVIDGETSVLDTLRRILAEEQAAGQNREYLWRNATRKDGIIERPVDAPVWDRDQREAFRADWEGIMSGSFNSGRVGLLEDGMHWVETQWSPAEMEYLGAREMTRAQCASVLRLDPRLIFASENPPDKDARTGFYVDRLGPLLTRLSEEVDRQLLPEFEPPSELHNTYTEFIIEVKLRGSFIEQLQALQMATGMAILTPNESRHIINRPSIEGYDSLVTPLNVLIGRQASPNAPLQTPGGTPAPGQTPGPEGQASILVSMTPAEAEIVRRALAGKAEVITTNPGTTVNVQVAAPVLPPADEIKPEGEKSPPWHIEKRGDEYCVVKDETGESVGCHDTRKEAEAHLRALYANVEEGKAAARAALAVTFTEKLSGYFTRIGKHLTSELGTGQVSQKTWDRYDRELEADLRALAPMADEEALRDAVKSINSETREAATDPQSLLYVLTEERAAGLGTWFGAWLSEVH